MKRQIIAALTVNLLTLIHGIGNGWVAPNLVRFQTDDSPIGRLAPAQVGLVVSCLCIGILFGTLVFGFLADKCGRKWTLMSIALPQIAASVCLLIGMNPYYVYASRVLMGLACGGIFTVIPSFVSEISQESIRGSLGTILSLTKNTGIVIGYVLASWLDYYIVPFVSTGLAVLFILLFVWLPESPDFLAYTQKNDRAERAYNFYGNHRAAAVVRDAEPERERITWEDFKEPAIKRGCSIAFLMIFFTDTCGVFALSNYMTELLQKANVPMDVYVATVALGLLQILGCVVSTLTIDRFGRRIMFMTSAAITGLALYAFGAYFYLQSRSASSPVVHNLFDRLQWLPVASLALVIFGSALAIGQAPYFLIAELLPTKYRSRASTVAVVMSAVTAFLVVQNFHQFVSWIGVEGTHWAFATICVTEVVYIYFYLPETRNLTIEEIQKKLGKVETPKNSIKVS